MIYEFTDEEMYATKTLFDYCQKQDSCDTCVFYQDSLRNGITYKFCHNVLPHPKDFKTVTETKYKNIYERG